MNELQQLHHLNERIELRAEAIRAEHDWWPCQRGCDHCCRHLAHPPSLTQIEWERMDEAVAHLPDSERTNVKQRIETLLQQIRTQSLNSPIICPFLNEQEGACHIYDSRPIICRTYGFFVARDHDQYCKTIEREVRDRPKVHIVWGNAESIYNDVEQIAGALISFEIHYRNIL